MQTVHILFSEKKIWDPFIATKQKCFNLEKSILFKMRIKCFCIVVILCSRTINEVHYSMRYSTCAQYYSEVHWYVCWSTCGLYGTKVMFTSTIVAFQTDIRVMNKYTCYSYYIKLLCQWPFYLDLDYKYPWI